MSTKPLNTFNDALNALNKASDQSVVEFKKTISRHHRRVRGVLETMGLPAHVRELKDRSTEAWDTARGKVTAVSKQAVRKVDHHAHKNPWMFVGAAAFVSSVCGFLLGRKSKR